MAILVVALSLPLRAHSRERIRTLVSYGGAPLNPRVWAYHSSPPKRNVRKGWFLGVYIFFKPTQIYSNILKCTEMYKHVSTFEYI